MPEDNFPSRAQGAAKSATSVDRAAILLMSMGEKDAAEVLKQMGPKEVQKVGTALRESGQCW